MSGKGADDARHLALLIWKLAAVPPEVREAARQALLPGLETTLDLLRASLNAHKESKAWLHKIQKEEAEKKVRKVASSGSLDAVPNCQESPEEPKARRYIVTDTSYESLGQLISCNSNGLLAFRDELISLLKSLEILAISKRR